MNQPYPMRCGNRLGNLTAKGEQVREGKRPARQAGFQGFPFDVLHHNEVAALGLFNRVNRDDVGMIERRSRPCLPQEALARWGMDLAE